MPLIGTRGAASSRGFGQFSLTELSTYWIDQFSGRDSGGGSTAVDSSGNIYVANYTRSAVGSGTYATGVMKLSTSGGILWQRRLGTTGGTSVSAITVDGSGNVYVATRLSSRFMVVMYNTAGVIQWQRQFTSFSGEASDIVYASSGNLYVCGWISNSSGTQTGRLVKITASTGALVWQRSLETTVGIFYSGVDIDPSENVYVSGYVNLGAEPRALAVKYNSSGTLQWQRTLSSSGNAVAANPEAVAVDSSGDVYLCLYYGVVNNYRMVLSKYNTSGTLQFSRSLFTTGKQVYGSGITLSASGDLYLTGYANTPDASYNAVIARYNTAGTIQFQRTYGTTGVFDYFPNIVVPSGVSMYSSGQGGVSNQTSLFELPSDGTKTGTYGVYNYAAGSYTEAALTLTSNTSTYTAATPTDTYATSTETDSVNSLTATRTAVP
jgi:hypothetical protein